MAVRMDLKLPYTHTAKAKQAQSDGADPRLIELVRVLARDAAEAHWQEELTTTNTPTNREEDPP